MDELLDNLETWVNGVPRTLLNIGVGPSRNREAEVFARLWPGIRIIGLEPNMGLFLDRLSGGYPGEMYPWGLWSTPCIKKLMVTPDDGRSSVLPACRKWRKQRGLVFQEAFIDCTTLDCLDDAMQHPKDIFLWMDIEGAELEALKGGCLLLESGRVRWIALEVADRPRRLGEPSEDDITGHLRRYGFSPRQRYEYAMDSHDVFYACGGCGGEACGGEECT